MPKPFRISIDVEEMYLGYVMRKLNAMDGVISIDFDFDQPNGRPSETDEDGPPVLRPKKGNGHTPNGSVRQIDKVAQLVAKEGLSGDALGQALHAIGIKARHAVSNSERAGLIKRSAAGLWGLTAKGKSRLDDLSKSKEA